MIGLSIPVIALSNDGPETSDRVHGRPCISIGFSWEPLIDPKPDDALLRLGRRIECYSVASSWSTQPLPATDLTELSGS